MKKFRIVGRKRSSKARFQHGIDTEEGKKMTDMAALKFKYFPNKKQGTFSNYTLEP